MMPRAVAALDVGKTHARLVVVAAEGGAMLWQDHCDSGGYSAEGLRQLDLARLEAWLLQSLATAARAAHIEAIVPVAHGAAAVLLDEAGGVIAAPDYEDPGLERVMDSYRPLRDPFAATFSPLLPLGLNLARQWHWLRQQHPPCHARVRHALLYPQYWAWRLCGVTASEVTSLGCHTDLWRPLERRCSDLAERAGWSRWLPPLRGAQESLGPITPAVAVRTGLPADCRVLCGIHDSNASYLCHLAARAADEPFALISSGTWTVIMARGADLRRLRESADMLANVDARGAPVATARFMGGREFAGIAGETARSAEPQWADLRRVLSRQWLALPAFAPAGGPFAGRAGRIEAPAALTSAERAALATWYVALMCDLQLDALAAAGSVVVDGPLAGNAQFGPLLGALRPGTRVECVTGAAGAPQAARILCGYPAHVSAARAASAPLDPTLVAAYRAHWRSRIDPSPHQ